MSRTNTTSPPPPPPEILRLINDFISYEPEKQDTYDECYRFIHSKYIYIKDRISTYNGKVQILNTAGKVIYIHQLTNIYNEKLKKYKLKFSEQKRQRLITDYYKPSRPSSSHQSSPNTSLKCKKNDFCAQRYLEKSIKEHKSNEELKQQWREYEERVQKIKQTYRSILNIPSTVLRSFRDLSLSSKKQETLNSKTKINKWSDKIIELISELTLYNPTKCKNLDECVEKITIIIDIIHSFIQNPNIMVEYDFSRSAKTNNKYDIQKYKIYKSFLEDYNITFNDNDFKHSLYIKLNNDYKNILIKLQQIKLDDCINHFNINKGGKSKKRNIKKM